VRTPILHSLRTAASLLIRLRPHDFRAAKQWMILNNPNSSWIIPLFRFLRWVLPVIFRKIPEAEHKFSLARPVSHNPIWLTQGNPGANYPFDKKPDIRLPLKVDVVVIGAGFTGASIVYHASRQADRQWVVLD